jgi:hypothetical protein
MLVLLSAIESQGLYSLFYHFINSEQGGLFLFSLFYSKQINNKKFWEELVLLLSLHNSFILSAWT